MEKDLWKQIVAGESHAYTELYNTYADVLYAYGMKIHANEELVAEAIQLLFIKIFSRRAFLSKPNSMKAYLLISVKRIILSQLDSRSSRIISFDDSHKGSLVESYSFDLEIDPQSMMIRSEDDKQRLDTLQQALRKLTKPQREVLYLRYYKNMSSEDVAEVIGTNSQVVRNMTYKIIKKLREENIFYKSLIIAILSQQNW